MRISMKEGFFAAVLLFLSVAVPAVYAQDFILGPETNGAKLKIDENSFLNIRPRFQSRIEYGDLAAGRDQKTYESDADFSLRRVGVEFSGKLIKDLDYRLIYEAGKNGIRGTSNGNQNNQARVLDAYVNYRFSDEASIRFGRGKLPYSKSAISSMWKQLFIEMPVSVGSAMKFFDDYWQSNLMLHGNLGGGIVAYNLAVADGWENGNYLNGKDNTNGQVLKAAPLYIARVELSPPGFVEKGKSEAHLGEGKHMTVGTGYAVENSIEYSKYGAADSTDHEDRTLTSADVSAHFGPFTFQGEYIEMKIDSTRALNANATAPKGWYVQTGYFIKGPNIEPVARYEEYDQDSNSDKKKEKDMTLGINWYLKGHSLKIGANWIHSEYEDNVLSDLNIKGIDSSLRNVYQLQAQFYL